MQCWVSSSRAALHALLTSSAPGPSAGTENTSEWRKASLLGSIFLRDKEEQPTSIMGALSSMGDPVSVRSTASLNSTRPSPTGGRLPSLSVLRVSAHPCNPGTHAETPWRSADALCWLSARRLLDDSRAEDCHDGCRARHGAAWAARGGVERGGAVCSTDLGTEVRLRVVARRTLIELEGPWRVVPAVYCVYRADTTLFHRHRRG